ncbi:MAG: M15 family metallopeptidase [Ignavibacterium sp.]|nr:M15 family metallopeptidase [Ignavibacterium sp.]
MKYFFICIITASAVFNLSAQNVEANRDRYSYQNHNSEFLVIDSQLTLEEALKGISIPQSIIDKLVLVDLFYYSFDGNLHKGQLLINEAVKQDIIEIFEFIKESRFPIEKAIPIVKYDWSDEASTADNNTTAFNYRFVSGTRIVSNHAFGYAIDINPMQNPYIKRNKVLPEGAVYDPEVPGTITRDSQLVKEFKKRGWSWGGDWKSVKDYQHFEKRIGKGKVKE